MLTTVVGLGDRAYPIHIGTGLLDQAQLVTAHLSQKRVAIVTNETVAPLYLGRLSTALEGAGVEVLPIVVRDGESFKTWETLNLIFDALLAARCERKTTLVALGGGVIGDLTGFAAATYLRGVPFIQVPTTLLSQVDSSVGGKTGINHPLGKNMIGAFYQPRLVLADLASLDTLPDRELSAGLAEVIKYGVLGDAPFFDWLEASMPALLARDRDALAHAVHRCCRNKAEIVAEDERESGRRALLNLGHTFGHALEAFTGYSSRLLHGEGVAIGMCLAFRLSEHLDLCPPQTAARVAAHLDRVGLPVRVSDIPGETPDAAAMVRLMGQDKKVKDGRLTFILARGIGEAFVTRDVEAGTVEAFLADEFARPTVR